MREMLPRLSALHKRALLFASVIFITFILIHISLSFLSSHSKTSSFSAFRPFTNVATSEKKLRIGILTFYTKDDWGQSLKALTFHNFKTYGKAHGYKVIDALEDPVMAEAYANIEKKSSPGGVFFFKATALRYFLPKFDWLMWADGDSIFLNHTQTIEEHIDGNYDAILATGAPNSQFWARIINAGHYIIKNSQFSIRFLKHIEYYSQRSCNDFRHEAPNDSTVLNGWLDLCNSDGSYWLSDQGVMQWLFTFKPITYRCHFKLVGFRDFNSEFPWYEDGDLVVHFPGRSLENRKELIGLFYKYTDFSTGTVDRTTNATFQLQTVYSDWQLRNMTETYKIWNTPCKELPDELE